MNSLRGEWTIKNSAVYFITKSLAKIIFPLLYRIDIKGEEVFASSGPAIILPKHQYWTDIPLVMLSFRFPVHFVAKNELFRFPGIRSYLLMGGTIPLDRGKSIRTFNSFKYLFSRLKADGKIVIFPEGTYFRSVVGEGKSRLIQMILQVQAESKKRIPFIPVGIHYGGREGWRRVVEVRIGPPLFGEEKSEAASLTHRLMEEISRLSYLLPGKDWAA